jgi:putative nucleotidyltransferase with HDIG domain
MKRILFVDDEPRILEGLQRMLRPQRNEWEMAFAAGGEAALSMLEASPFDVIVSDMRMPGMDGAALLQVVREKYPSVLRIILSGYTELEAAFRTVPVAHQFLLKPCEPNALRTAISRATSLVDVVNSKMLVSIVGSMQDLPSLPRTYAALRAALSDPNTSLERVAGIVEQDVAISAKVLQLVNSAFFGVTRDITNIRTAIGYLGINTLQSLVLSVEVFRSFQSQKKIPGFSFDDLQAHSQLTARIIGSLPGLKGIAGAAVVAGLLHDVGKLVLIERTPEHFARAVAGARQENRPLFEVEEKLMGVSHAEVGAYLLSLWGIPYVIVEAVAHHHHPERVPHDRLDVLSGVYFANWLAHERSGETSEKALAHAAVNQDLTNKLGVAEQLTDWLAIADSAAREFQGAVK